MRRRRTIVRRRIKMIFKEEDINVVDDGDDVLP